MLDVLLYALMTNIAIGKLVCFDDNNDDEKSYLQHRFRISRAAFNAAHSPYKTATVETMHHPIIFMAIMAQLVGFGRIEPG